MATINDFVGGLGGQLTSTVKWVGITILLLVVLGGVAYWAWQRKQWNITVEFKMRRSNSNAVYAEIGKGIYRSSRGYCIIKRKGILGKKYEIKDFDPTVYLQGNDILTVVQVGPTEFAPVIPESFDEVIDEKTGKKAMLMVIKGDTNKDRAWAAMRNRDLLSAYTIRSFIRENAQMIGFGILMLILIVGLFLGFGMILDRLPPA